MGADPLGRQPRHRTGRRVADYTDAATQAREAHVKKSAKAIWVKHPPQENAIGRVLAYRLSTLGDRDDDEDELEGLCLAQASQAGKSATMKQVKKQLAADRLAQGLQPNPFQVVIVGLDKKTTLKSVLQDILIQMKDPDWMIGTEKQLRERIRNFVKELGVELIVIDECQHLHKDGNDVADVTDALKRLLDLGVAPLILVGNFDAQAVFDRNPQLRARLGVPMRLPAFNPKSTAEAVHFRNFVVNFGAALEQCKAVSSAENLSDSSMLDGLRIASTGYFGRVARILRAAAAHAAARGAISIEEYDLSCIVRELAIPSKWVTTDPFSTLPS